MDSPGFEWHRFYYGGDGPDIISKPLCRLPRDIAAIIGARAATVHIRLDYLQKAHSKHKIKFDHFPMMAICIQQGDVYRSDKGLDFFFYDPVVFRSLFFVGVKIAGPDKSVWIQTFHRKRPSEHKRLLKKLSLILPRQI